MRAVTFEQYGDASVLQLRDDFAIPDGNDNQVLVRVEAAALNPYDRYMMSGVPYVLRLAIGWSAPKMMGLGQDFAGTVVSIGRKVKQFKVGDRVFGDVGESFKASTRAFADYVCVTENDIVRCPDNIRSEQAAGIPMAGRTALIAVRDYAKISAGNRVLVFGASGGVGRFVVQIAKIFGANVTAMCGCDNIESVKALGADQVIDYQQTGISELGRHYHAVIDMAGVVALSQWQSVLIDKGRYVQVGAPYQQGLFGPLKNTLQVAWQGIRCSRCEWTSVNAKRVYSDRLWLAEKAQSGQLVTHIGHCFPLNDIQEAMRVIESGHTGGKVIISVNTDE